jgi:aminoglycoside phosphotransferase (APT) family kinase protein
VGTGARVLVVRAMPGASSSAVHDLVIEAQDGRVHRFVLRRFTDREWLAREPDLAGREAEALTLLEATPLTTPRLIAVDETAEYCDVPAVLMTRVPGRPLAAPDDLDGFVTRLAEPLPIVHATPLPARAAIPEYRPYYLEEARRGELRPPTQTRARASWKRAIEVHAATPPTGERAVFLHRDYHPGNVLWRRDHVAGVADWVNASRGPVDADVGHCRLNLAIDYGLDAADGFLSAHRALTDDRDFHPYWDIAAAVGMVPEHPDAAAADDFVTRAIALI